MPRQKKTDNPKSDEQAQAIARILLASCSLIDTVIGEADANTAVRLLLPVSLKMETYLDGRPPTRGTEPDWVARMRQTVTRFKIRLKLSQGEAPHALH